MEDILLLKYPKLKDNILKARGAGKSDEDIETLIDRTIERKKLAGWTMDKVNARIGIDPASLTRVSEAMRFNAMESISDAYKLSYGKSGELYDRAKELNLPISAVQEFPDIFKDRLHERETTDRNPAIAKFNALGEDKLSRMVGGITVGFMGAASGMFDGVDWLTGWEKAKQAADSLTNASKSLNGEIMQGREGNTFDALMQGLGSSGVFILPGVAVASMVGKAAKLGTFARTVASWTGAGVSAATESLAEAGGVYRQVMERTGDEMAASAAASSTFWLNMPTNFVSDKLAFFSDLPAFNKWLGSSIPEHFVPVASQAIRGFVAEGAQETMQGAISSVYGEDKSWGDLNLSEIAFREGLPGGIVGALFGIGVGQDIRQAVTEQNASRVLRESATKVVEKAKEVLGRTGRPVEEIDSASALLGAYSMVASKRLGISPEEWFEGKGLEVAEKEATEGLVLNQEDKGQIALSSGKAILKTFANADASTIVHEMGHLFLADTQQAFAEGKLTGRDAQDFRTLAKWLEAEEGQELTREQHEKFAQGFEQYLREGKAPSVKLKRVFERFRQWLTDIYANTEKLGAPLTDDIRDVFDRMLAFDSDIELARKLDAVQDEDAPEQTDYPTPEEEAEDEADDLADAALDGNVEAMASIMGNEDVKPTPKERAERLKRRAGEWVERQVARVAEGSRIGDFVEEWHALKELMASEKERGKGLKKGGGRLESRARVRAIRERLAGNDTRKTVRQMVKGIAKSTKGNISDRIRVEIRTLLDGFNLKKDDIRGLDALRAEFDAYMADNADADVRVEEETEALNARAVGEMTLAELADLAVQVKGLAKVGREEYKEWRLKEAEQQDKVRSKLMKPLENVRPDNGPVTTETMQKKEGTLKQIVASTLRPSRLFDWIDGRRNFKGPWYKHLQEASDKAWDAFLQWKDKREMWLEKAIEKHGMTLNGLGEIRLQTKNEQGQAVNLNLEECMHIYAAWGNWLNRQALRYGNGITQEVAEQAIGELTEEERAFAYAIVKEWEDNFERVNGALIEAYQVGMEKQKHYVPMFRMARFGDGGMSGTDSMEALVEDIARLNSWRRLVANRGYAKAREILNPQFQSPIQMGLVSVWHRSVSLTEHTTAHARLVKDLQHVVNEGGAPGVPSLLKRVEERHGRSTAEAIKNWVNTVASPGFYKGFTGLDNGVRKLRANSSIARISWNLATIIKQPVAFMLYTADAGPLHMASAIAQLAANPHDLIKWVWEQDPQVKEQAIDRTLEELRKSGDAKYMKARRQLAKSGFAPVLWLDMITRVAGWKAVYDAEISRGAAPEEARLRAQRVTLNTQNAAAPKELPMYMKHSEVVNLITQFTNQANQIFNVTFYDLPSDIIAKRGGHAIGTMSGLILSAMLMGILKNGRPPEDPAEVAEWVGEETLSSVPILGSSMSAVMSGFRYTGTSIDSIGAGLVNAVKESFDGDYEKAAYAAGEVIALTSGLPYQGAKRGWKAVYNGDWKELFGWARGRRKTSIPTW